MLDVLPWSVSVLVHAGMVLVAVFIVWSTLSGPSQEVIIPVAQLAATPNVPLKQLQQQRMQRDETKRTLSAPRQPPVKPLDVPSKVIGLNLATPTAASPFEQIVAEQKLATRFLGLEGGNAKQLAFLIDASGSQIDTMYYVLLDLKKTISQLSDQQAFTVVFYRDDELIEAPPAGMKRADAQTKQRIMQWLGDDRNVQTGGSGNPLAAIRLVLRYKPQVLFILSDNFTGKGRFEIDQDRMLAEIEKINTAKTKISTIQFIYHDQLESIPGKRGTLEMIAERTGGYYKFLSEDELLSR